MNNNKSQAEPGAKVKVKSASSQEDRVNPTVCDRVEVGNMCVFRKENKLEIGRILQFSHYEEKKVSANQYKGLFADTKRKDLGVLCTWFEQSEVGKYRMCSNESHCFLPLQQYVCTLTRQCVVTHESNHDTTLASLEEFTLTQHCREFVLPYATESGCNSQSQSQTLSDTPDTHATKQVSDHVIEPRRKTSRKWLTINHVNLYESDKDDVTTNKWLNDQHMFVAQNLIKQQYPHFSGLFPTVIQGNQTLPKGSLQIIHTNNNHWVAVSTCNMAQEDFILYDSMYTSVGNNTRIILAKMITTDRPYFTVRVANITKQSGESDCGVYAIAFITHIASGLDPSLCVFDQVKMREHLTKCF